ncbi:MAG: helix-turn-helix domain-containing protein [Rubripirellula sp.]
MQKHPDWDTLLLRPKEASRLLAVSPRKLWSMTFEDEPALPHIRCGRLVRYSQRDLEQWIDSQRKGVGHDRV